MTLFKFQSLAVLLIILYFLSESFCTTADTEAEILIKFKNSMSNVTSLKDWDASISPCQGNAPKWNGLRCTGNGTVFGLKLENRGLMGLVDVGLLVELPDLRALSLMNNSLNGPMPNIKKLSALKVLYLSYNKFSGEIPADAFSGMRALQKVYLAGNGFTGKIPKSLAGLDKLGWLDLGGNQFDGKMPNFRQKNVVMFNLSHNQLHGHIPDALSKMDVSLFAGNQDLCGEPLIPCKSTKKKIHIIIAAVVVGSVLAITAIAAVIYSQHIRNKKPHLQLGQKSMSLNIFSAQTEAQLSEIYSKAQTTDLHFVRDDRERFELPDLLRASAENLGSGGFGSSYKAVLLNGSSMVVKRFRQMNKLKKEEFRQHMSRLGRLSHPNLLPLFAFYQREEEKLLVSDFAPNGSLASHLHSRRSPGGLGLDWPIRLRMIKGVARGLDYLYRGLPETLILPHGHLKSSNVVLNGEFEPQLTNYALLPVINRDHAKQFMVAFKSPEFAEFDRITRKTDVWSLGILILELLTGKFPANYADLASWVNSVVREEWTGEVFDKDMRGGKRAEGEMLKLLKIGICCCEWDVEKRWEMKTAVESIEELKESDNLDYSGDREGDVYSSTAITEDGFSFSIGHLNRNNGG